MKHISRSFPIVSIKLALIITGSVFKSVCSWKQTSSGSFLYHRSGTFTVCIFSLQDTYTTPLTSIQCWHVHCEECWLRTLVKHQICWKWSQLIRACLIKSLFFFLFLFRVQRSCVLSATPSPHLETWGGSFCDTATQKMWRGASFVLTNQGWTCGQLACHRLPPSSSSSSRLPAPNCVLRLTPEEQQVWPLTFLHSPVHYPCSRCSNHNQIRRHTKSSGTEKQLSKMLWDNIYHFCNHVFCFMSEKSTCT